MPQYVKFTWQLASAPTLQKEECISKITGGIRGKIVLEDATACNRSRSGGTLSVNQSQTSNTCYVIEEMSIIKWLTGQTVIPNRIKARQD